MKQFIIIQGPATYYKNIIECYKTYPNIVYSTLNNSSSECINEIQTHFPVVVTPFNFPAGTGNLNCQCITSTEGLKLAKSLGATHALKIRSDMIITDILKFMDILKTKSKISFLAWHTDGYLVDYINYGQIDEMIEFWNVFELNFNFAERNLIQHFSTMKKEPISTFTDVKKYVEFFMADLKNNNICINWLKYDIKVSEYYIHNCYKYE